MKSKIIKQVPISLLTGYLGSGKTTLINHVLRNNEGFRCAVIVNDIGEINIDAELIQKNGAVTTQDETLVPLSNGCICCTLKVDLMKQITELILTGKFDYLLIEASGICEPLPIAQSIDYLSTETNPSICRLDNIVTVVDALRMATEFGCGDNLLNDNIDEEDIENLLIQQIEFCSTIVLNKTDKVTPEQLAKVKAMIKTLQPKATIIESTFGKIPVAEVLNTRRYDLATIASSAGWAQAYNEHIDDDDDDEEHEEHHHHDEDEDSEHHHDHHHEHHHNHDEGEAEEYGISTFVYRRRRPFAKLKFKSWVDKWPKSVIRSKGMLWFEDERDIAYVFEQSGVQITADDSGKWFASAPEEQRKELLKKYPDIESDWDEKYGDREIKLVFIGQNMDKENIISTLDECLGE